MTATSPKGQWVNWSVLCTFLSAPIVSPTNSSASTPHAHQDNAAESGVALPQQEIHRVRLKVFKDSDKTL